MSGVCFQGLESLEVLVFSDFIRFILLIKCWVPSSSHRFLIFLIFSLSFCLMFFLPTSLFHPPCLLFSPIMFLSSLTFSLLSFFPSCSSFPAFLLFTHFLPTFFIPPSLMSVFPSLHPSSLSFPCYFSFLFIACFLSCVLLSSLSLGFPS